MRSSPVIACRTALEPLLPAGAVATVASATSATSPAWATGKSGNDTRGAFPPSSGRFGVQKNVYDTGFSSVTAAPATSGQVGCLPTTWPHYNAVHPQMSPDGVVAGSVPLGDLVQRPSGSIQIGSRLDLIRSEDGCSCIDAAFLEVLADSAAPHAELNAQLTGGRPCLVGRHQLIDFSWSELAGSLVVRRSRWQLIRKAVRPLHGQLQQASYLVRGVCKGPNDPHRVVLVQNTHRTKERADAPVYLRPSWRPNGLARLHPDQPNEPGITSSGGYADRCFAMPAARIRRDARLQPSAPPKLPE